MTNLPWKPHQHQKKYLKHCKDDFSDYSFDRKWNPEEAFLNYEKTGKWRGYDAMKPMTLDYSYIQQIANALSATYHVKVVKGKEWSVNIETKTLTYNPISFLNGTKADVLESLLHEIGHLRHTSIATPGIYEKKYPAACHMIINIFEDYRIDEKMQKSYPTSQEIYDVFMDKIKQTIESYQKQKQAFLDRLSFSVIDQILFDIQAKRTESWIKLNDHTATNTKVELSEKIRKKFNKMSKNKKNKIKDGIWNFLEPTIHDYIKGLIAASFNIEYAPKMKEIDDTVGYIPQVKQLESTQVVSDFLEKNVFPKIEPLLKQHDNGYGLLKQLGLSGKAIHAIMNPKPDKLEKTMLDCRGHEPNEQKLMPIEWQIGKYDSLKDSVTSEIIALKRLLRNIKQKDLVKNWLMNLKAGKLDKKTLYRYPAGRYDIFKRQKEKVDRTKNFAFSLVLDVSGSMRHGYKSIQTARGSIILSEVFKALDIPFEIVLFGTNATTLKRFDQKIDKSVKDNYSKITESDHSFNRLLLGLEKTTILSRPENNKYVVILTDGGFHDEPAYKPLNIAKSKVMEQKGVKFIGIDIETSDYCALNEQVPCAKSRVIHDAEEIPEAFSAILKDIIKKI